MWQELAEDLGGAFSLDKYRRPRIDLAGPVGEGEQDWNLVLDLHVVSNGQSSTTYGRARGRFENVSAFPLKVRKRHAGHRLAAWFGLKGVEIGHRRFDDTFHVRSRDAASVRNFLLGSEVSALLLDQGVSLEVKSMSRKERREWGREAWQAIAMRSDELDDPSRIKGLATVVESVCDRLHRIGLARPHALILAAVCAAGLWAGGCDTAPSEFRPPVEEMSVELEGATLYAKSLGVGEPIVVVHGGPGLEHTYLLPALEPLARTYQLVFYDQRALGRSTGELDSVRVSMPGYISDLDAVREAAGVEQMNLMAHSWGTLLALLYTLEHPERVRTLILLNPVEPGSKYRDETRVNQLALRTMEDSIAIDSIMGTDAFRQSEPEAVSRLLYHNFRSTFADPRRADELDMTLSERTARNGQQVARLVMGPLGELNLWPRLAGIDTPTLVVHGAIDPIPDAMVRELSDSLPDARLVIIEGAGHFPFIEKPAGLFGEIQRFLDDVDAR